MQTKEMALTVYCQSQTKFFSPKIRSLVFAFVLSHDFMKQ